MATIRDRFEQKVDEAVQSLTANLIDGRCEDIEQYRRYSGQLYGLKQALGFYQEAIEEEINRESE